MSAETEIKKKVKKLNTALEDFLKEVAPKDLICSDKITGIIILRSEDKVGIHTTCVGGVNFAEAALAVIDFDQHSQQYKIPAGDNLAA